MTRAGLELFLRAYPDIDLVGQVSSGEEALQFCEEVVPDVVLMDIKLPGIDGVEATALLRKRHPRVQVIALSSYQDRDLIERVVQAGAISYLLKTATAQELIHAIQAAYAGWSVLSPEAADALVQLVRQQSKWADLTEREQEVLVLMAEGLTNAHIAQRLGVGLATAKFHVGGVLTKLGVSNRAEAVTIFWQQRLNTSIGPRDHAPLPKGEPLPSAGTGRPGESNGGKEEHRARGPLPKSREQ
jgi:DNA-binding NarL/FixJ family response regulator